MSEHTEFVETVHRHLNDDDFDALRPHFAADVETQTPGGTLKSFDDWRAMGEVFQVAAPDARHQSLRVFEDGDSVIVEGIYAGTHTGPLVTEAGEVPASGNSFALPYVDIFQLRDGVCVSHRVYWDNVGFMMQLGAMG
ncbi:MAG TPA: ester cyclase [Nocardioides sp.]|nr:ester cyclase [Nocardioides sp.]